MSYSNFCCKIIGFDTSTYEQNKVKSSCHNDCKQVVILIVLQFTIKNYDFFSTGTVKTLLSISNIKNILNKVIF